MIPGRTASQPRRERGRPVRVGGGDGTLRGAACGRAGRGLVSGRLPATASRSSAWSRWRWPGAIQSRHPRGVVPGLDRTARAGLDLFALIAIEDLQAHGLTAAADFVAEVIVVTVGLSVLLHGLTAGIIAARWPAAVHTRNRPAFDSNERHQHLQRQDDPDGRAEPGPAGRSEVARRRAGEGGGLRGRGRNGLPGEPRYQTVPTRSASGPPGHAAQSGIRRASSSPDRDELEPACGSSRFRTAEKLGCGAEIADTRIPSTCRTVTRHGRCRRGVKETL